MLTNTFFENIAPFSCIERQAFSPGMWIIILLLNEETGIFSSVTSKRTDVHYF